MTTLIIPIYNGEAAIPDMWRAVRDWKSANKEEVTLVFVNDGSTDNTGAMLDVLVQEDPSIRISHLRKNVGKGMALATAVEQVSTEGIVVFTDVDLPYGLSAVDDATSHLDKHPRADMVIGSRSNNADRQYSWYRKIFSQLFRLFLPTIVRTYKDTQCGLKAFRVPVAKDLFSHLQTSRWVFDVELLLRATAAKYVVHEQSVSVKPLQTHGAGGLRAFRDGIHILRDLCTIRVALRKKKYDA